MLTTGNSWAIAAARAFLGALAASMVTALTTYSLAVGVTHGSTAEAVASGAVAGGILFCTIIATRLGFEGYLDRRNPDASPVPPAFAPKPEVGPE